MTHATVSQTSSVTCAECKKFLLNKGVWKEGQPIRAILSKEVINKYPSYLKSKKRITFYQKSCNTGGDVDATNYWVSEGHILCNRRIPTVNPNRNTIMGSTVCSFIDITKPYTCRCDTRVLRLYGCLCGGI